MSGSAVLEGVAARRLQVVGVPEGAGLATKERLVVLGELTKMGWRVTNVELLTSADTTWLDGHRGRMALLAGVRGGDVEYVPLFTRFPDGVPGDDVYFAKRWTGFVGSVLEWFPEGERLETGIVVPPWLLDLDDFGADPVLQLQTPSMFQRAKRALAKQVSDTHVEWMDLQLVRPAEVESRLRTWATGLLAAKSAVPDHLAADLRACIVAFGPTFIDPARLAIKENRALVLQALWESGEADAVRRLASTPTDLLRLFASLTDSDRSLSEPIRFPRFSRAQRRLVLSILEDAPALAEDVNRYRGLWLAIARYVHPGDHRDRFPKTAAVFRALARGPIRTFNSRAEALIVEGDLPGLLDHLADRPTQLGRRVHHLLRRFPGSEGAILDRFEAVGEGIPVKTLLVLRSYFGSIHGLDHRTVVNKRGRVKILPNPWKGGPSEAVRGRLTGILEATLLRLLGGRESWAGERVWIDPALGRRTVPLQQRAASDGLWTLGRGSLVEIDFDKVLRLFVWWKERGITTDLDLSVIQFGAEWEYRGHVSYTRLSGTGIRHSGDLQSAPLGAAEFVDITLSELPEGVRYLAIQVHRYCGASFATIDCHAGWMVRQEVDASTKTFDIATVANKFDLHGDSGYALPLVVDLDAGCVLWTDLYVGGKTLHNNVEGSVGQAAVICREVGRFLTTRPVLADLADLHVRARGGARVESAEEADITIGLEGSTWNAGDVGVVLSEML